MAALTVRRAAEGRRMRWRNGGGETVEIAVHPAAADLADVDWRVSMAAMTADGPFSAFPGLDRTLVVVAGDGLELAIGHHAPVRIAAASDPLRFPADVACKARLLGGPVANLNVMTRRSRFRHTVERLDVRGPGEIAARATTLLVCCAGTLSVEDRVLERHDTLVSCGPRALRLIPREGPATGVLVTVLPDDRDGRPTASPG